ncbi:hypothetical protein [Dyella thiooxydans]|uniref:hypothetical protein n=1 Tax=Dyella thiooxydans TaxID=445710 RepID=UPI0012FC085A|nr:hypothetical protein [Dyella thiooxydans]
MESHPLPPLIGKFVDGVSTWETLDRTDFSVIGYLLSCHLILESYIDEYIQAEAGKWLDFSRARLSFSQKISIINFPDIEENLDFMPALAHMNNLRNKLSHNVRYKISTESVLPLIHFLEKSRGSKLENRDPISVIGAFTSFVGAWFAAMYVRIKEGKDVDRRAAFERWISAHYPGNPRGA